MVNKTKADRIHDLLPSLFNSRNDVNWSGLVDAIGQEDDRLAQLIASVRDQFFVKTASRPYLDTLAANNNITRPKLVGMDDVAFRQFIPILAYQPKQVKKIIDDLLDLFFLKEATTAFLTTALFEPFILHDGWDLQLRVDDSFDEIIVFHTGDFTSIAAVTAEELVASYNRQSQHSYAVVFFDSISKKTFVKIYTNTTGSTGSLEIEGGLANIALQLNGFLTNAGNGANTQWTVTKIGDTVTFTHSGGASPGISLLQVGDLFISNISGNVGSFPIKSINIATDSFVISNLFATPGVYIQVSANDSKFVRADVVAPFKQSKRALAWETEAGQIVVEMPATPSVVQRNLKGGFFINGTSSLMTVENSSTSLTVVDASTFPASGIFVIEPVDAVTSKIISGSSSTNVTSTFNGRLISPLRYFSYSSIAGNTLLGISPNLPAISALTELTLSSLTRTSNVVTCVTALTNNYIVGETVIIANSSGIPFLSTTGNTNSTAILTGLASTAGVAPGQVVIGTGIPVGTLVDHVISVSSVAMTQSAVSSLVGTTIKFNENINGSFVTQSANSSQFTVDVLGVDGVAVTPGTAIVETINLASSLSNIVVTTAVGSDVTKIVGPYVWDKNAPFVLSAVSAVTMAPIVAGTTVDLLTVSNSTIPNQVGFVVIDYGLNNQEGPIKYFFTASGNIVALDPSYVFQQNHSTGAVVRVVSHKGPHEMSGIASEFAPYVVDPGQSRLILQDILSSVTSAGIFVDFLIRFPKQLYAAFSTYD